MIDKGAQLCLLKCQKTNQTIVVGNCHIENDPRFDHVKYGQAIYYLERIAKYIRENKGMSETLPFVTGGDYNSLPISSVLSAFYDEDIEISPAFIEEMSPSAWTIPTELSKVVKDSYKKQNKNFKRKVKSGLMDPIIGNLETAYACYDIPAGHIPTD